MPGCRARPPRPPGGMGLAVARWGVSPATGYAAGAARHPDRLALVDDDGRAHLAEVDVRTDRLAGHLRARGVVEGSAVGVLARNGRGLVESVVALGKCGADVLYLNTGWGPEQTQAVLEAQGATALLHDEEFAGARAARRDDRGARPPRDRRRRARPAARTRASRQVILTSGTTGTPRGPPAAAPAWATPSRCWTVSRCGSGGTTVLAAPAFHAWGLGHLSLAMLLGSTLVMTRRFDPERVLRSVEEHRADALVVVPVMLDRLLEVRNSYEPRRCASSPRAAARCRRRCRRGSRSASARCCTACTARPRSRTPPSPPRTTCARTRAPPAGRRTASPCAWSTTRAVTSRPASPAGSSSAAAWPSPATPTARTRTASARSSPPATAARWTPRAASPSWAGTTTWWSSAARTSSPAASRTP